MSTKDSSKTGDKSQTQLDIEKKLERDLVFGNNPSIRAAKYTPELGDLMKKAAEKRREEPLADRWRWTFQGEPPYMNKDEGIKEKDGKITYSEIDWDFIDDMSNRMDANTKYPPLNYQKGMDVVELAKAVLRHARKIVQPIPGDEETIKDHIEAIGTNAMMMNYQVKKKVK